MKKILFLSFYYKPDLCAGSFRTQSLIEELNHSLPSDAHVTLLTTMPQRYNSYTVEAESYTQEDKVEVYRFQLPSHNSGFLDQAKSFYSFYKQVLAFTKNKEFDVVFATSSRLFTAFLGARLARQRGVKLYLDIRDIFRDTLKSLLPSMIYRIVNIPFKMIENYTFAYADKINLVSEGFNDYFINRFPNAIYSNYYNGIDKLFFNYNFTKTENLDVKVITYAGNIGQGQGIETIVPQMAQYLGSDFLIQIVGDGGQRIALERALQDANVLNVKLKAPVSRAELLDVYKQSDYLFLHLNDLPAFEKVLPSKIFEYAVTNKRIIAGVNGFARQFITDNIPGSIVFHSSDIVSFESNFKKRASTSIEQNPEFTQQFSREKISKEMIRSLFELK